MYTVTQLARKSLFVVIYVVLNSQALTLSLNSENVRSLHQYPQNNEYRNNEFKHC